MKNILLLLVLFIGMNEAYAKDNESTKGGEDSCKVKKQNYIDIIYDFSNNTFKGDTSLVFHNQLVRFVVKNANRAIYDIEINDEAEGFNNDIPDAFKSHVLEIEASSENENTILIASNNNLNDAIERKTQLLSSIKKYITDINNLRNFHSEIKSLLLSPTLTVDSVEKAKSILWNERTKSLDGSLASCKLGCGIKLKIIGISLKKSTLAEMEDYLKVISDNRELLNDDNLYAENNSVVASQTTLKELDMDKLLTEIDLMYNQLNENLFTTSSNYFSINRNDDILEVTTKIELKEDVNPIGHKSAVIIPYKVYIGGVKIDFSTGPVVDFLKDESYSTKVQVDSTNSKYQVIDENNNNSEIGLAALVHLSYRMDDFFAIGINSGIALGSEQKPRYLLGGSLLFGREKRIIFNVGVAYGSQKVLSSSIIANEDPANFLSSSDDLIYVDKNKKSLYFGITYNLNK